MAFPTHIVSAGGIVEDGNGNILLVKAHDDGWVYPGGITEVGENLIDGVIREIKEESGIEATVSHLISVVSNTAIHKWYDGVTDVPTKVMFDFVCKAVGGELATSDETSDCRWVPKENVLDVIFLPAIRMRYEAYLNFNGSVNYIEFVPATTSECNVKLIGRFSCTRARVLRIFALTRYDSSIIHIDEQELRYPALFIKLTGRLVEQCCLICVQQSVHNVE